MNCLPLRPVLLPEVDRRCGRNHLPANGPPALVLGVRRRPKLEEKLHAQEVAVLAGDVQGSLLQVVPLIHENRGFLKDLRGVSTPKLGQINGKDGSGGEVGENGQKGCDF